MRPLQLLQLPEQKNSNTRIGVYLSGPIKKLLDELGESETYQSICSEKVDLYKSPSGYTKWNFYLKIISMIGSQYMQSASLYAKDYISGIIGELCRQALAANAPARYISKELCEAFMRTPVPTLTKDILDVLPFVHIILPRNFIYDADGEEVQALLVKTGELHPKLSKEERELQEEYNRYLGGSTIPPLLEGARGVEVATVSETGSYFWVEYVDENAKSWYDENVRYKDGVDTKEDMRDIEKISRIAINSILVHLYEPELITTDKQPSATKALGFNQSKGRQPLSTTWIGKSFRYKREQRTSNNKEGDSRKAVRAHWRRGHWHSYLQGPGRKERTIKWIKPIYVRGEHLR